VRRGPIIRLIFYNESHRIAHFFLQLPLSFSPFLFPQLKHTTVGSAWQTPLSMDERRMRNSQSSSSLGDHRSSNERRPHRSSKGSYSPPPTHSRGSSSPPLPTTTERRRGFTTNGTLPKKFLESHNISVEDILDPQESSSSVHFAENKPLHTSSTPPADSIDNPSRGPMTKLSMRHEAQAKLEAKHAKIKKRTTRKMEVRIDKE
jgi:hypothetical protein